MNRIVCHARLGRSLKAEHHVPEWCCFIPRLSGGTPIQNENTTAHHDHDAPIGRRNYQECVVVDFPIKAATESELLVAKWCRSQTVRDGVETQPAVSWVYR